MNNLLPIIKLIRQQTGIGLKEAKDRAEIALRPSEDTLELEILFAKHHRKYDSSEEWRREVIKDVVGWKNRGVSYQ